MKLSLKESQVLTAMAKTLYQFLPGSGSWRGHVNFATVAREVGLEAFWPGGSKLPAIIKLLELTLENRRDRFEPLTLAIVRRGLAYRAKNKKPITRREMLTLNRQIKEVGFKFQELWDEGFLSSLAAEKDAAIEHMKPASDSTSSEVAKELETLKNRFDSLSTMSDRQAAGYAFEKLLNQMFELFHLAPRSPFRVVGEQIDGSILLDNEIYLIEAKWTLAPVAESELLVFRGKIEGKSAFTRGMFIAIHGFTSHALTAIACGKQPTFFLVDGYDIRSVLQRTLPLELLLRAKLRRLAEEGVLLHYPQLGGVNV